VHGKREAGWSNEAEDRYVSATVCAIPSMGKMDEFVVHAPQSTVPQKKKKYGLAWHFVFFFVRLCCGAPRLNFCLALHFAVTRGPCHVAAKQQKKKKDMGDE